MEEQQQCSGEWWVDPWWLQPGSDVYSKYTKQEMSQATETLKRYFDAAWANKLGASPRRSFIYPSLCLGGSTQATNVIVQLGTMLTQLRSSEGLDRVISDLKEEKEESAYLELEIAHAFVQAGYSIRFPKEGENKSPDIFATNGNLTFGIECKRLQQEAWEQWEFDLTSALMSALPDKKHDKAISVNVALNTRLTQICMNGDKEPELNNAFLKAIVDQIIMTILSAMEENELPLEIEIYELATIRIAYQSGDNYGSVSGMERASVPIVRRILQNGLLRACDQIPDDVPGIVVIYSNSQPRPAIFKLFFDAMCQAQPERFSGIVSVVICTLQTIFRHTPPVFFLNSKTRFAEAAQNAQHVIKNQFGGILVGPEALTTAEDITR